jgi:hypothetical protein
LSRFGEALFPVETIFEAYDACDNKSGFLDALHIATVKYPDYLADNVVRKTPLYEDLASVARFLPIPHWAALSDASSRLLPAERKLLSGLGEHLDEMFETCMDRGEDHFDAQLRRCIFLNDVQHSH